MENGIGRTGYRLLAFLFMALGFLGLAIVWYATPAPQDTFVVFGAATASGGLVGLFLLGIALSFGSRSRRAPPVPRATPEASDMDYELPPSPGPQAVSVSRPAAAPSGPATPTAAGPGLDPAPVHRATGGGGLEDILEPGQVLGAVEEVDDLRAAPTGRDPTAWPARRTPRPGPGGRAPAPPDRVAEFADRYTQDTPMVRSILTSSHGGTGRHRPVREVTAKQVPAGRSAADAPQGTTMGRCSGCNTVLLAPDERPLRLRCPRCSRVTMLKA